MTAVSTRFISAVQCPVSNKPKKHLLSMRCWMVRHIRSKSFEVDGSKESLLPAQKGKGREFSAPYYIRSGRLHTSHRQGIRDS